MENNPVLKEKTYWGVDLKNWKTIGILNLGIACPTLSYSLVPALTPAIAAYLNISVNEVLISITIWSLTNLIFSLVLIKFMQVYTYRVLTIANIIGVFGSIVLFMTFVFKSKML